MGIPVEHPSLEDGDALGLVVELGVVDEEAVEELKQRSLVLRNH